MSSKIQSLIRIFISHRLRVTAAIASRTSRTGIRCCYRSSPPHSSSRSSIHHSDTRLSVLLHGIIAIIKWTVYEEIRPACTLGALSVGACRSLTLRAHYSIPACERELTATHSSGALFMPAVAVGVGAAALPPQISVSSKIQSPIGMTSRQLCETAVSLQQQPPCTSRTGTGRRRQGTASSPSHWASRSSHSSPSIRGRVALLLAICGHHPVDCIRREQTRRHTGCTERPEPDAALTLRGQLHTACTRVQRHTRHFFASRSTGVRVAFSPRLGSPRARAPCGARGTDDEKKGDTVRPAPPPCVPLDRRGTCRAGVARRGWISFENHAGCRFGRRARRAARRKQ